MARWITALNRWVRGESVTPVASAARTTNGDSGWIDAAAFNSLALTLAVTAVGGDANETLDVVVETASDNAGANTRTIGTFAQRTQPQGATTVRISAPGVDAYYRVRWTVGGTTPSFTFSVSGEAK